MAEHDDKVLRFERRRLERRVPGLGPCVFAAIGGRAELDLARHYDDGIPDYRVFANELIAAALEAPAVDAAGVDALRLTAEPRWRTQNSHAATGSGL